MSDYGASVETAIRRVGAVPEPGCPRTEVGAVPDEPKPDAPTATIRTNQPVSEADYEQLRQRWEKEYANAGHAHRVAWWDGRRWRWRPTLRRRLATRWAIARARAEGAAWRIREAVRRD